MFLRITMAFVLVSLVPIRALDSLELLRNLDLNSELHRYYDRPTKDRFAALQMELEAGRLKLDHSSEKAFLLSLLRALEIPASSQMLVFSTTSLQLSLISPSNPRALYFNEDTYLGFIPGGKIEIVSIDPELGGIFYILDIPKSATPLNIERSRRCMNCHSGSESGYVPGLVIKSVVPGIRGGSLDAFRIDLTGHAIPFEERFGGWYLTGNSRFTNHWANTIGRVQPDQGMGRISVLPGERFSFSKYPVSTSDLLPQLVHEHQAGFVNRMLQGTYVAREQFSTGADLRPEEQSVLKDHTHQIVRYLLFADEAPLPPGGIKGDPAFIADFRGNRREDPHGASLKDFDLESRLFRYRCSYMIYSPLLTEAPSPLKHAIIREFEDALAARNDLAAHITDSEKLTIRSILRASHPDFKEIPADAIEHRE